MKQETRGGARQNSGRKPVQDKKIPITIYLRQSLVKKYGGADRLKTKLTQSITH